MKRKEGNLLAATIKLKKRQKLRWVQKIAMLIAMVPKTRNPTRLANLLILDSRPDSVSPRKGFVSRLPSLSILACNSARMHPFVSGVRAKNAGAGTATVLGLVQRGEPPRR